MKKTCVLVMSFVMAVLIVLAPAIARAVSQVYISGVQTGGGTGHTTDDFIELFNPSPEAIILKDFVLVKRTASAAEDSVIKSWTEDALIPAHSFYLWANSGYAGIAKPPDIATSGTVADNNGIALRYGPIDTGQLIDALSWGQTSNGFAIVSSNIPANSVLRRQDLSAAQSLYAIEAGALPRNSAVQELPVGDPPEEPPSDPPPIVVDPSADPPPVVVEPPPVVPPVAYLPLKITEVLPNPTGTDTGYEAVELYNPNNTAVDIDGWFLGDGAAATPAGNALELAGNIAPGGYKAIVISAGKFTLNNTGGDSVQLFSPDKIAVDSITYTGTAAENESFQYFDDGWLWLDSSMGLENLVPPPGAGEESEEGEEENEENAIAYGGITITEFYPAFGGEIAIPMLEVVNRSEKEVDLEGWKVDVEATHLKKPSDTAFVIDNSNAVAPGSYGAVALGNVNGSDFEPAGKYWVILYSPDGKHQDAVNVKSIVSRMSFAKVGTLGWEWTAWSPAMENKPFVPPHLEFTEILPAYKDTEADAFVELWNAAAEPIYLGNLKIKIGTKATWLADDTLQPGEYHAVFAEDLPAALTAGGKKVLLTDANEKPVASASYPKAKIGLALMLQEGGKWMWTAEPTPGAANVLEAGASAPKATVKTAAKPAVRPAANAGANPSSLPPEETPPVRKNSKKPAWVFGALGAVLLGAAAVVWFMAKEPPEPEEVSSS